MDSKTKCKSCGKDMFVWEIVEEGCCAECIDKMWKELQESAPKNKEAIERLTAFASDYKKALAKFRSYLAEKGYELTYRQLQNVLADMGDEGIKTTQNLSWSFC